MSWPSKTLDKTRNSVDSLGKKVGLNSTQRRYFRYGVATMGGGMAWQYEYSRNKGMNSDEATKNATTGGMQYSEVRQMQTGRLAEEAAQVEEQKFLAAAEREREKARSQIAVRVRRGSINRGGNRLGQTMAAGLGTTGATAGGSPTFASMLGLL